MVALGHNDNGAVISALQNHVGTASLGNIAQWDLSVCDSDTCLEREGIQGPLDQNGDDNCSISSASKGQADRFL